MQCHLAGALAAFVLTLGVPLAVLAQDAPCRDDAARLCADAQEPGARLRCLEEKRDELSEACRARIDRRRDGGQARRPRLESCRADVERLCAGIEPGNGALRRCLAEHRDALSEECRAQLPGAR